MEGQVWTDKPILSPEQLLSHRIRRSGNFCGALILAMYTMQFLISLLWSLGLQWKLLQPDTWGVVGNELADMAIYLLFLVVPAVLVVLISGLRVPPFPTRRIHPTRFVCLVCIGMAVAVFANVAAAYVLMWMEQFGLQASSSSYAVDPSVEGLILSLISTAVLPALVEEMIFRGFFLGALRPFGNGMAVVLSAVTFGLFHGNVQQFVFTCFFGLILAFLTVQTGSIWPAVVTHFCNNAMSVLLTYASNFYSDAMDNAVTVTTFALVCVAGMVGAGVLLCTDRGSTAREDVFRPMGNSIGLFTPAKRLGYLFTAPLWLIAVVVLLWDVRGTVSFA